MLFGRKARQSPSFHVFRKLPQLRLPADAPVLASGQRFADAVEAAVSVPRRTVAQVKRLYYKFGAKRLMWGTDWPISLSKLQYPKTVELFRDHLDFFTGADREWMLGKTVQQVWPFGL